MKVEVINNLEKCPEKCDDMLLILDEITPYARQRSDDLRVLIDCAHSGVCKFRDDREVRTDD